MIPAIAPMPMKGDQRRHRSYKVSQNQRVPLWTAEPDGELFDGVIRVPTRYAEAQQHTNEALKRDQIIEANLERWVAWRAMRGWFICTDPKVVGPMEPPEGQPRFERHAIKRLGNARDARAIDEFDHGEEIKWFVASARFKRMEPVYARLEDMIELRHLALRYGVDPDRDKPTATELPESKDYIEVEGGVNLLDEAEKRRQAMGVKREEYLFGPLGEPL